MEGTSPGLHPALSTADLAVQITELAGHLNAANRADVAKGTRALVIAADCLRSHRDAAAPVIVRAEGSRNSATSSRRAIVSACPSAISSRV